MKNITPPIAQRLIIRFIVVVNYYRNMLERFSHVVAPLTKLTSSKVKFKWTEVKQKSFKKLGRLWPTIIS